VTAPLGISLSNLSGLPPSRLAALGRLAEARGFTHLNHTESYNDIVAYLMAAADATERVTLVAGIANAGFRHPVLLALGAAAVDEVSGGRLVLGIGAGTQWWSSERRDLPAARPLEHLREYVAVVRAVLRSEASDLPGPRYPVAAFRSSFAPVRSDLPIYLAALGPAMLELAGEIADGAILNLCAPEDITAARERLAAGARRAGRAPEAVGLIALVNLCLDDDIERARAGLRAALPTYLAFPGYGRRFTALGFGRAVKAVRARLAAGDAAGAVAAVPDELIERVGAFGPAARCRGWVERFRAAGVAVPILSPRNPGGP
jgi:alkanesulfonate monooxygenase SsuD/methylene tetrahydromethanopterin reductase-like flavin-dependent oxidoreductase (luciferase family)